MLDLSLLEHFNQYYRENNNIHYSLSLRDFYNSEVFPRLKNQSLSILDLGTGIRSLFEDVENLKGHHIVGVDISEVAVSKARENLSYKVDYKQFDFTQDSLEKNKFDLIFDSHALHCITIQKERNFAFKNIFESLKEDGFFCAEMMIQKKSHSDTSSESCKYIPSSYELEKEILAHGFRIIYFMVMMGLEFESNGVKADLVRVICSK